MGSLWDWIKEFDPGASFVERVPPHPERIGEDLYEWEAEDLANEAYDEEPWGRQYTEKQPEWDECGSQLDGSSLICDKPEDHPGMHSMQLPKQQLSDSTGTYAASARINWNNEDALKWYAQTLSDPTEALAEAPQAPGLPIDRLCPSKSGSGLPCMEPLDHPGIHRYAGYKTAVDVTPEPVLVSKQLERIADALEKLTTEGLRMWEP